MRASTGTTPALSQQFGPAPPGGGETEHLLRAMAAVLARQQPASTAEALRVLRRGYPDIPLSVRIAALCAGGK
jgi:hypothetical protein